MFFRKVFSPFFRANFCFYKFTFFKTKLHKNGKKAVECRPMKSVFSLQSAKAIPLFFVISRAHDCLDALRYQLKHVKENSSGSAESKDANSK